MANYKPTSLVEVSFDETAFEVASQRVWSNGGISDGPSNFGSPEIPNFLAPGKNEETRFYYRISAEAHNQPMLLSGVNTTLFARNEREVWVEDERIPLPEEEGERLASYIGYPIVLHIWDESVNTGQFNLLGRYASARFQEGYRHDPQSATGGIITMWLGFPTNPNREQFTLVDYEGRPMLTRSGVLGSILGPRAGGGGQVDGNRDQRPAWVVDGGSTFVMEGRVNRIDGIRSKIITKKGRLDSDGYSQPNVILGPTPTETETGVPINESSNANIRWRLSGNTNRGVIRTPFGKSVLQLDRQKKFNFYIETSQVYPALNDNVNNIVVEPSRHVVTGIISDRVAAGLENTPQSLGAPTVEGIFEIPTGSYNYYNLVQMRELQDNRLEVVFESSSGGWG